MAFWADFSRSGISSSAEILKPYSISSNAAGVSRRMMNDPVRIGPDKFGRGVITGKDLSVVKWVASLAVRKTNNSSAIRSNSSNRADKTDREVYTGGKRGKYCKR